MGLFDKIIIVSDIDGTFIDRRGEIPPRNLTSLDYFKKNGGRFTIATGREHFLVYPSVPQIDSICNYPAIVCNGAYLYDFPAHKASDETFLDDETLVPLIRRIADACPEAAFRVDARGCLFVERVHEIIQWVKDLYPDRVILTRLKDIPHGCWHKVAFDGPPKVIDQCEAMLSVLDERFVHIRSGADIVEIQAARATKGSMISRLKQSVGDDVTIWAIGDYENDYALLTAADRCAVPENGLEKLKRIPGAVCVCDCDDGAIADLIDRIEEGIK